MKSIQVDAILFDMDGTLIDSTPGVLKAWITFCRDYGPDDPTAIAHAAHGRRMSDTLREFCLISDQDKLKAEIVRFEEEVIQGGPVVLPGVSSLLSQLNSNAGVWTIVTSASDYYALRALERCGVPLPTTGIVTSNDVSHGKPHPEPYLAGAMKVGKHAADCLVIEDAISGLVSGRTAGAKTMAVCTSTTRQQILSQIVPDFIVADLTKISVRWIGDKMEVTIDDGE